MLNISFHQEPREEKQKKLGKPSESKITHVQRRDENSKTIIDNLLLGWSFWNIINSSKASPCSSAFPRLKDKLVVYIQTVQRKSEQVLVKLDGLTFFFGTWILLSHTILAEKIQKRNYCCMFMCACLCVLYLCMCIVYSIEASCWYFPVEAAQAEKKREQGERNLIFVKSSKSRCRRRRRRPSL